MFHGAVKSLSQAECREMENFLQIPERNSYFITVGRGEKKYVGLIFRIA
jgi:hypothetical protein